jgi:hypothetical protein
MRTKFWLESLKGGGHSEDLGEDRDNIKTDLREIGLEVVDWIHLAQDRAMVNTIMNHRVP